MVEKTMRLSDGSQLYYQIEGKGFPIIFLHGNGLSSNYFEDQVLHLKKDYLVVRIDSRGHGLSSNHASKLSFTMMARDVKELLDQLGFNSYLIVGHSDGANLALVFATLFPEKLAGLLLNSPNRTVSGLKLPVIIYTYWQYTLGYLFALVCPKGRKRFNVLSLLIEDLPLNQRDLTQILVPVWLLVGSHDLIKPAHSQQLADDLPKGRLIVHPKAGHNIARKEPAYFNGLIRDLMQEITKEKNHETTIADDQPL